MNKQLDNELTRVHATIVQREAMKLVCRLHPEYPDWRITCTEAYVRMQAGPYDLWINAWGENYHGQEDNS